MRQIQRLLKEMAQSPAKVILIGMVVLFIMYRANREEGCQKVIRQVKQHSREIYRRTILSLRESNP